MKNPYQKCTVNKNMAQQANDENTLNDGKDENVPKKNDEILNTLNSVATNEIEWSLHTHRKPHLIHDICVQNKVD